MSTYILAIDQGTSSTKAVIFNEQAQIVARGLSELQSIYPQPGYVEQDPEAIYQNVLGAVSKCIDVYRRSVDVELKNIRYCGISNQRATFLLWDKSGTPLCNAIVWQCRRSIDICNTIKETKLEEEIIKRTGLVVDPSFSGTKIKWLHDNVAEVKDAIKKGSAYGGTVDSWLLYKLTRGKSYFTDYTNASRTLLFNISTLQWDKVLLRKFGLKSLKLPEAKPSAFDFGKTTFEGLFSKAVKITGMIGDSHAAAFGETCFDTGEAKATLGTGSSILMNTGNTKVASSNGMVTTICWSLPDRTDYALEGIIISAGATLQWMRDQIGFFRHAKESERMAASTPNNGGVYFVPAFKGLGAPHWKMESKALLTGLTFASDKNHIVRAALESIAYQLKDVISVMESDAALKLKELFVDGGVTSNNLVMQFIADLLKVNVRNISIADVSALGAAYIAGLQGGIFKDLEALKELNHQQRRYLPGDNKEKAQLYYQGWLEAIKLVN